jgi:hypothetical protein
MTTANHNCIVCAEEFEAEEMQAISSNSINGTRFKICQSCLDKCDPETDYREVRSIISSYLNFSETKSLFKEAQALVDLVSNKQ